MTERRRIILPPPPPHNANNRSNGKFAPGNRAAAGVGGGASRMQHLRCVARNSITDDEIHDIMRCLIAIVKSKGRDRVSSAKLLLEYCCGKPVEEIINNGTTTLFEVLGLRSADATPPPVAPTSQPDGQPRPPLTVQSLDPPQPLPGPPPAPVPGLDRNAPLYASATAVPPR